jgi:histidine ammonia-lyase
MMTTALALSPAQAPVPLDGERLTVERLVAVARRGAPVDVPAAALARVAAARDALEAAVERGDVVYGATTGVGAHKRVRVPPDETRAFEALLLASHRLGQGPALGQDVARAAAARLVNGLARGFSGVRVEVVQRLVAALNEQRELRVPSLGSLGQSDLLPMASLVGALLGPFALASKETLALINTNALATALGALAVDDCREVLAATDTAAALSLEAFRANLSILHPVVTRARPQPELRAAVERFGALLRGSSLWERGAARNLQDPLSFRTVVHLHAGADHALAHAHGIVEVELNATQDNPAVDPQRGVAVSWGGFEAAGLAAALDYVRLAIAPVLTSACERTLKLLWREHSALATGLAADAASPESALSELGVLAAALTGEARALAHPVSFDIASSSVAEGLEDRMTQAPLAARRLQEMVALGRRVIAVELVVAGQAVDLRHELSLGAGTAAAHGLLRRSVPFVPTGAAPTGDLEALLGQLAAGDFAPARLAGTRASGAPA